jgi:hypothetical protein
MHSKFLEWIKQTLYDIKRFEYLLVSAAKFSSQNEATLHDRSIFGHLLTNHDFESATLK